MATQEAVTEARNEVANALKRYLRRKGMKVREFNQQVLGIKPNSITPYAWIGARGLPSQQYIPLLAKALHKPAAFFQPRADAVAETNGANSEVPVTNDNAAVTDSDAALVFDVVADTGKTPLTEKTPVIVHARNPRTIARERAALAAPNTVAEVLEGPPHNSLIYWSHSDGSATVTMLYRTDRKAAQKIFRKLSKLGVDASEKMKSDVDR